MERGDPCSGLQAAVEALVHFLISGTLSEFCLLVFSLFLRAMFKHVPGKGGPLNKQPLGLNVDAFQILPLEYILIWAGVG